LQYAHENGCPWDRDTTYGAAANGFLECLKYCGENGCPWNPDTVLAAFKYNKVECLFYCLGKDDCPRDSFASFLGVN